MVMSAGQVRVSHLYAGTDPVELRDLPGLGGDMAGEGPWLALREVIARFRAAGRPDGEWKVRSMIDRGKLGRWYADEDSGYRYVFAEDVDAFLADWKRRTSQAEPTDG